MKLGLPKLNLEPANLKLDLDLISFRIISCSKLYHLTLFRKISKSKFFQDWLIHLDLIETKDKSQSFEKS